MGAELIGYVAIALMALVVYGTRIAGPELMTLFRLTPRVEAVLKGMAISVLIALVVTECLQGGPDRVLAVIAAALVMTLGRGPVPSMVLGVAVAAMYFLIFE